MPAAVTFTLSLAPLPLNFEGTPQEFAEAMVDRLTVTPTAPWSSFITGSVIPITDTGPLLYDSGSGNKEWRVWDTGLGAYSYLVVNGAGIVAGSVPVSKLATDLANAKSVLSLNNSGVPTLVTGTLGDYLMMGASGPAFVTVPAPTFAPALATNAGSQTVAIDTVLHKLTATSETFDPQSAYDAANSRYLAPTTGYYAVYARAQCDNSGGDATGMEIAISIYVNGGNVLADGTSVASPPGARWYPRIAGIVQATAGNPIEVYLSANDGTNAGNLSVSNVQFSVHRIQ